MLKNVQKIEKYLYIISPLLVLASLFYYYITGRFELFSIVTLVAGVLIGLLFFLRFSDDIVKKITKRKVRYGANSAIITLVVLALIVIVYLVTFNHNKRFDLTASKRFSLSSQTISVLERLQGPVKIYAFFSKQQPTAGISQLLNQFKYHKKDISFEIIDPDVNPGKVKELGVEEYGQVVVEWSGKTEKVKKNNEEGITNTLIKLSQTEPKIVYFTVGHGERSIEDYGGSGYDKIKAAVESENYKAKEILLLRESSIPDDCAVLVAAGPKTDFNDHEISLVEDYVRQGGRVFFLLDPVTEAGVGDLRNIIAFADTYGILVGNDVIIDPLSRVLSGDYFMPVINSYTYNPITRDFRIATFMRMVRSVDTKDKAGENMFARTMANTGDSSWAETGIADMKAGRPVRFDEGKDKRGPVPIMAYSTITVSAPHPAAQEAAAKQGGAEAGEEGKSGKAARSPKKRGGKSANAEAKPPVPSASDEPGKKEIDAIVMVAGDSDFISNSMYQTQGNKDLFLNSLNYLADRGDLITIRPKQQESVYLTMTAKQGRIAFFVSIILVPLVVIVVGIYINIQRRIRA